jgi:beta-galactosidase/beta-glucuronidase
MRTKPIHRMHLKGPWGYEWLEGPHALHDPPKSPSSEDSPLLAESRVRMPSSWQSAFGDTYGCIRFSRRFQRPTNLDDNERVHVAFDGIGGRAEVSLNGQVIGRLSNTPETTSFDITAMLKVSNELSVELLFASDDSPSPGGLHKPVAIEIHLASDS